MEKCQIIQSLATEPFLEPGPSLGVGVGEAWGGGGGADTDYLMAAHGKCIEWPVFGVL